MYPLTPRRRQCIGLALVDWWAVLTLISGDSHPPSEGRRPGACKHRSGGPQPSRAGYRTVTVAVREYFTPSTSATTVTRTSPLVVARSSPSEVTVAPAVLSSLSATRYV